MDKLLEIKFGSHLYGTDTENSDLDLKSIYLPTARQIILGTYDKVKSVTRKKKACERNNKEDVDIEISSLDRFLDELMDGQIWALDVLFAPPSSYLECSSEGDALMTEIFENRDKLLTKNINAFVGYSRKQAHKYGIKGTRMDALKRTMALLETLPNWDRLHQYTGEMEALVKASEELISLEKSPLIEVVMIPGPDKVSLLPHLHVCGRKISFTSTVKHAKECYQPILDEYGARAQMAHLAGGKDWKALSHAVRVSGEALELLATGHITFPRPDREMLLNIKLGNVAYEAVSEMIENGLVLLNDAQAKSTLREKPDYEWANDLVYREYSKIVKDS